MTIRSEFDEAFTASLANATLDDEAKRAAVVELSQVAMTVLYDEEYHGPGECAECDEDHCVDPVAHEAGGGLAVLSDAVRVLHGQAHDGPTDTLSADRCRREPCASAGSWMAGPAERHTFGALAGSR